MTQRHKLLLGIQKVPSTCMRASAACLSAHLQDGVWRNPLAIVPSCAQKSIHFVAVDTEGSWRGATVPAGRACLAVPIDMDHSCPRPVSSGTGSDRAGLRQTVTTQAERYAHAGGEMARIWFSPGQPRLQRLTPSLWEPSCWLSQCPLHVVHVHT